MYLIMFLFYFCSPCTIKGTAERMRRVTTFVILLQVIWDIPDQVYSVKCIPKLLTIINTKQLAYPVETRFGPKLLVKALHFIIRLIISAYPCTFSINQHLIPSFVLFIKLNQVILTFILSSVQFQFKTLY